LVVPAGAAATSPAPMSHHQVKKHLQNVLHEVGVREIGKSQ